MMKQIEKYGLDTPSRGAQISVAMDGNRYMLLKRIGLSRQITHKDFLIDCFDEWLKANIDAFPLDEQEQILNLIAERAAEYKRKP